MERISRISFLSNLSVNQRKERTYSNRRDYVKEYDDNKFIRRFRLSKSSFNLILDKIKHKIGKNTERNRALNPSEMLLLALRFYASGNFMITVADFCGVSMATASRVIKAVSFAIAELSKEFIRMPANNNEIQKVNHAFHKIAKFPKVVGCIDGTHIKIQSFGGEDAEIFRNRKGYFSFNVQAVCNANLEIVDLVCRWPGSAHDSNIFNNSRLKHRFEQKEFGDCYLLGDSGYGVSDFMMTPLLQPNTNADRLYNESQIRTRNCIERCFGVLKRRFPVLSLGMRVSRDTAMAIIVACTILHNVARMKNDAEPPVEENTAEDDLFEDDQTNREESNRNSNTRTALIQDYFARL